MVADHKTEDQHSCFTAAAEQFGKRNTKLVFAEQLPNLDQRLVIASAKVDPKKKEKPLVICATFCPFCGAHLP